jgi:hypothetical protein
MARRPDERPSAELAAERLRKVAAGTTADNRPTIRATPRTARLSGSLPPAKSGARVRRVSRARIAGMGGIAVLLSAALLSAGYALALARVGDGGAVGGGASGSPSVTVPPSSGSPSASEFTASPNACLYLTDHPQVVAPLVPEAKLWAMHKSTNSCSWEPTQKSDGEITRLSVADPLLPANLGDCPTQGERLPGLGDEGYVSEETDLDAYGWHERDVRVYFRVSNLGVCVKYRTASRASMPPSAKAEVTEFARVLDRWAAQALDDRGN